MVVPSFQLHEIDNLYLLGGFDLIQLKILACGVCSSARDLGARIKTYDTLPSESIKCAFSYTFSKDFPALVSCFSALGFTEACSTLWAHYVATNAKTCAMECLPGESGVTEVRIRIRINNTKSLSVRSVHIPPHSVCVIFVIVPFSPPNRNTLAVFRFLTRHTVPHFFDCTPTTIHTVRYYNFIS